jgi:hypothetical protein
MLSGSINAAAPAGRPRARLRPTAARGTVLLPSSVEVVAEGGGASASEEDNDVNDEDEEGETSNEDRNDDARADDEDDDDDDDDDDEEEEDEVDDGGVIFARSVGMSEARSDDARALASAAELDSPIASKVVASCSCCSIVETSFAKRI